MNDDAQDLMLQVLTAAASGSTITPVDVLTQLGETDPAVALAVNAIMRGREAQPEVEEEPWPGEAQPSIEPSPSERRLLRNLERLTDELRELQTRNDSLAAALGACYLCFGSDPACEVCGGRGRPGYFEPDRALFGDLIAPALERLKQRVANGDALSQGGEER